MSAQYHLAKAAQHLKHGAESLQAAGRRLQDGTAIGACATLLADLEGLRKRLGRIASYTGGER